MEQDLNAVLQLKLSPQGFLTRYSETSDRLWIQMANYFKKTLVSILESKQEEVSGVVASKASGILASQLYSQLLEYNHAQCSGSNLQVNLQLEAILIQWFEMGRKMSHY